MSCSARNVKQSLTQAGDAETDRFMRYINGTACTNGSPWQAMTSRGISCPRLPSGGLPMSSNVSPKIYMSRGTMRSENRPRGSLNTATRLTKNGDTSSSGMRDAVTSVWLAQLTEDTQFRPVDNYAGTEAIYTRGTIAERLGRNQAVTALFRFVDRSTDRDGAALSMPVVPLAFDDRGEGASFLSLATDPIDGMQAVAALEGNDTTLQRETIYRGSVFALTQEQRVVGLEWTDRGADGVFNTFYRTIPVTRKRCGRS